MPSLVEGCACPVPTRTNAPGWVRRSRASSAAASSPVIRTSGDHPTWWYRRRRSVTSRGAGSRAKTPTRNGPRSWSPSGDPKVSRRTAGAAWSDTRSDEGTHTSGVLAERISRGRMGPGARAAAQVGVLAGATQSGESRVADFAQQWMLTVDGDEAAIAHVAERDRQESRRIHGPVSGHEDDALAVTRRHRGCLHRLLGLSQQRVELRLEPQVQAADVEGAIGHGCAGALAFGGDAAEERRFHGAHRETVARRVDQEMTHILVLGGVERPDADAAPGVDEEEHLPDVNPLVAEQLHHAGQFVHVVLHNGGVDLHRETVRLEQPNGLHRVGEVALHTADALVRPRARPVQAE